MPNERWTIKAADGEFFAHVARPEGPGPFPAVVVIQEIFGVNAVVTEVCDRLAGHGFLAVAPDLFWRLEPGVNLTDRTQAEWDRALDLMNRFDVDQGIGDLQTVIDVCRASDRCTGKVGAVGYCLGGRLAYLVAARTDADAAVGYYGVGLEQLLGERPRAPLMLHIAAEDGFSTPEARDQVIAGLKDDPRATLHVYAGRDHAFARPGGKHFHPEDAAQADRRTAAFLKQHLA